MKISEKVSSRGWPNIAFWFAAGVLPWLMLPEVLLQGRSLYFMDLGSFHYPLRILIAELWKTATWPLWNPYSWNGMPLLAESEVGALSPFNIFFALPIEHYQSLNLLVLLTLSAAGISAFALARQCEVTYGASLLAALAFACGGYAMTSIINPSILIGLAMAPLCCALLLSAIANRRVHPAVLAGFVLSLQIYSAHPQTTYYTIILLAAFAVFGIVRGKRQSSSWVEAGRVMGYFALICIVGLGLSMPQILPALELLRLSARAQGMTSGAQMYLSMPPDSILTLFFARLFLVPTDSWRSTGIYDEFHFYIGLAPLICAALAWPLHREPIIRFAFVLLVLSVLLALGGFTPIYWLLTQIPDALPFRVPARWLLISNVALIILVGKGADAFWLWAQDARHRLRMIKLGRMLTVLYASLLLTIPVALIIRPPDEQVLGTPNILSIGRMASRTQVAARLLPESVLFMVVAGLALAALWLFVVRLRWLRTFAVVVLLITFGDLFLAGGEVTVSPSFWQQGDVLANFVTSHDKFERIYSAGATRDEVAYLGQGHPSSKNLFATLGEYVALTPRRNLDYVTALPFVQALRMNGTRWVALPTQLSSQTDDYAIAALPHLGEMSKVWETSQYSVYEVPDPLPHAYAVYRVIPAVGETTTLDRLRDSSFNPITEAVVESAPASLPTDVLQRSSLVPAQITSYSPNFVSIEATLEQDGLLVLTDTYYPGWRAWVDGSEQPILRTNYLFRGVMLTRGQHTVEFRFWPQSFQLGLIFAAATLMLVTFGCIRHRLVRIVRRVSPVG
jgi:Bacterial membrane protein YfhO